jgi:hypothetical protein
MCNDEIDKLIKEVYKDPKGKAYPILDGIVNTSEFNKAKFKILWILKEPYGDIDENGESSCDDREDKRSDLNEKDETNYFQKDHKTFDPIIYIAYCIFNNFIPYTDHTVNYIKDDPSMIATLKKIAYINISKLPGKTDSNGRESHFRKICQDDKYKEVLKKQIDSINADIIIGGNTLQYLHEILGIQENQFEALGKFNMSYIAKPNKIFINSYHPAYFMRMSQDNRGEHLDAIINTIKNWNINVRKKE